MNEFSKKVSKIKRLDSDVYSHSKLSSSGSLMIDKDGAPLNSNRVENTEEFKKQLIDLKRTSTKRIING